MATHLYLHLSVAVDFLLPHKVLLLSLSRYLILIVLPHLPETFGSISGMYVSISGTEVVHQLTYECPDQCHRRQPGLEDD